MNALSVAKIFFFFSSRRRHTRWYGDWSSDVCSSDLRTSRLADSAMDPACCIGRDPPSPRLPAVPGHYEVRLRRTILSGSSSSGLAFFVVRFVVSGSWGVPPGWRLVDGGRGEGVEPSSQSPIREV